MTTDVSANLRHLCTSLCPSTLPKYQHGPALQGPYKKIRTSHFRYVQVCRADWALSLVVGHAATCTTFAIVAPTTVSALFTQPKRARFDRLHELPKAVQAQAKESPLPLLWLKVRSVFTYTRVICAQKIASLSHFQCNGHHPSRSALE